jgi:hypothetical protein
MATHCIISYNIIKSKSYRFRYRAKNINGWSDYSDIIYITAAVKPAKPPAPTLISADNTEITLQFYKPEDNGGS